MSDAGTDAGFSACTGTRTFCDPGCADINSDRNHCGACNNRCDSGERCAEGMCITGDCPGTLADCDGSCVSFDSNPLHCGACGNACSDSQECQSGTCVCGEDFTECDGACVDTNNSAQHCGLCGRACEGAEVCVDGSCRVDRETECDDGMDDDGDGATDCADPDCNGYSRECACGGTADMGIQVCEGGSYGTCGPCLPPECGSGAGEGCETYGYDCVAGQCEFNPRATFDVLVINVDVPKYNNSGYQWDPILTSRAADVLVEMSSATATGRTPMSVTVEAPTYRLNVDQRLLRNVEARDLMNGLRIFVSDDDDGWDDSPGDETPFGDDHIGECTFRITEAQLNGRTQILDCIRDSEQAGFRARVQFLQGA